MIPDSALKLWRLHPFRLHIAVLFTAVVFAVGTVLAWSTYLHVRNSVLTATEDVFARIEREMRGEMANLRSPVEAMVDVMSRASIVDAATFDARMQALPALAEALNRHVMLESVYAGYYNGDFFQLHALHDDRDRKRFHAPRHAAYRLQSIERGARVRFTLLDAALNAIADLPVPPGYRFDPRVRPWYVEALRTTEVVQSEPYVFFTTRETGQTISRRAEHGRAVVGADITLVRLSETLELVRPTPSSQLALFNAEGRVIAQSGQPQTPAVDAEGNPVLTKLADVSPVLAASLGRAAPGAQAEAVGKVVQAHAREWLVRVVPLARTAKGISHLGVATPRDELLTAARAALQRSLWLAVGVVLLAVPLVWWVSRRIAANLNALTAQAAAIRRFNFEAPVPMRTQVIEINDLGLAMRQMRETIRKFVDISTALSAERNFGRLLRRILLEARDASGAEGGVIYLIDEDGRALDATDQAWDAAIASPAEKLPEIPLQDEDHPVVRAARGATAPSAHVLATERPAGMAFLDARYGASPVMLVTVPLLERGGGAVGVLCVFLPASVPAPSQERLALVEAFARAGAVAIHNQRLLATQKALFNSLIAIVAGAIDAKSQHTAAHCLRVPELTNMLTQAACDQKQGPFANFELDEEDWEALHIAGGLHDCGKVTTPEYVVNKATKLETLYDRIHEVRMRFEVLKRDAEIACLKAIAAGGDESERKAALACELRALDEDFAFVAACNEGEEFMAPEKKERLKAIAGRTWQRTLDDRLGVSWEEAKRMAATPARSLPAIEHLLTDKVEHVIERQAIDIISEDNPWGFKLKMPASLYNRGELYNLLIERGTLNEEERYKIRDHIAQTIIMLSTTAVSQASQDGAGAGRGPPRKSRRSRVSETPSARGHEHPGEDYGHRGHLRGSHRARPAVQEDEEVVRGAPDHERHEKGRAYRPGPIRFVSQLRRVPTVRREIHASGVHRRSRCAHVYRGARIGRRNQRIAGKFRSSCQEQIRPNCGYTNDRFLGIRWAGLGSLAALRHSPASD